MTEARRKMNRDLIFKAIDIATKAHTGQFRKCTQVPYIVHPLNVAKILVENNATTEQVIAGILHDTVEDTDLTLKDIEDHFGEEIAVIVEGCSEADKSDTWKNRKSHTISFLKTASFDIRIVSCADKLDNVSDIIHDYQTWGEDLWNRFKGSRDQQAWYYLSLADIFQEQYSLTPAYKLFSDYSREASTFFKGF